MIGILSAAAAMLTVMASTPATPVLKDVALHDGGSVMQSFAHTSPNGTWIFAQVQQAGRFGHTHTYHLEHGDLTLTHVAADGHILSWMYLNGFGHGEAISVEAAHPGLWIWIEAMSAQGPTTFPDGFGRRIARFKWRAGATISSSSPGVQIYNPNPGTWHNAPSLDLADGLVAARYMDANAHETVAVYELSRFLAHDFTAIRRIPRPSMPGTGQGWALLPGGMSVARLTGDPYSASNTPPGNTFLTVFDESGITSRTFISDATGLTWREPEGVQADGGQICNGFASGPATARRANIYCR